MWINWREKIISDPFSNRNNAKKKDFQLLDEFLLKSVSPLSQNSRNSILQKNKSSLQDFKKSLLVLAIWGVI